MTPARPTIPPARLELQATRVAFLLNGDAYFKALTQAMFRAERSIRILGWDVDARTLLPDPFRAGATISLRRLVNRLARRRRQLRVHILGWDFAPVLSPDRPLLPTLHLDWRTRDRVRFESDARHPPGASHLQKVVVVDDRVAFVGGTDLAIERWSSERWGIAHGDERGDAERGDVERGDTGASDARRVDPSREARAARHDVQLILSGPAAETLGDLARTRWRRATGEALQRPGVTQTDPWPRNLTPDLHDATVEVATTDPPMEPPGERTESAVERSLHGEIAAAREHIYVENQYFSCPRLAAALRDRLDEDDGPEVVLVAPRRCTGWLEAQTMGALRRSFLATVREGRHAATRFRAVAPFAGDTEILVHARVMVVDDRTARVGSATFSRRSQSVDTECDATVHGTSQATREGVRLLCARLLAGHLGRDVGEIEDALAMHGSLVRLVDEAGVGRRNRHVRPLDDGPPSPEELTWLGAVGNPERPIDAARFAEIFADSIGRGAHPWIRDWMKVAAATTVSLVVALLVIVAAR